MVNKSQSRQVTMDDEKYVKEAIVKCLEKPETLYRDFFGLHFGRKLVKAYGRNWRFTLGEIAAREILSHISTYTNISSIRREQSYYISGHEERARVQPNVRHYKEKQDCKNFYGHLFGDIGKVIDYEIPLKGTDADEGVGDIDLLAYNEKKKPPVLTLLEYKKKDSNETLLRCVLEIYTYLKQVNKERLAEDFSESPKEGFPISPFKVDKNSEVKAAVFVHKGSLPDKHFRMGENTHIRKLMRELQVGFVSEFDGKDLVKVKSVKVEEILPASL